MSSSRILSDLQELRAFSKAVNTLKSRKPKYAKTIDSLSRIDELDLEGLGLRAEERNEAAQLIANIIENNPYITRLYLGSNYFNETQAQHLTAAFLKVKADPSISELDLSSGYFGGASGLLALSKAARSPVLKSLVLNNTLAKEELTEVVRERPHLFSSQASSARSSLSSSDNESPVANDFHHLSTEEEEGESARELPADRYINPSKEAYEWMYLRLEAKEQLRLDYETTRYLFNQERVFGTVEKKAVRNSLVLPTLSRAPHPKANKYLAPTARTFKPASVLQEQSNTIKTEGAQKTNSSKVSALPAITKAPQ